MEVILQHPYRRYDNSYRWIMKVLIFILQLIYYVCRIFKRGKKIVMLSRQADSVPLDMKLLRVKLNELYPDYKVVVLGSVLTTMADALNLVDKAGVPIPRDQLGVVAVDRKSVV